MGESQTWEIGSGRKVFFRPIEKTDEAPVKKLILDVMAEYMCIGEAYSSSDPEVAGMYDAYNVQGSVFYVLTEGGKVKGCGGLAPLSGGDPDTCELRKMYFYKDLRGYGLGRRLLEICMDDARALGYRRMYLETVARMDKANQLYILNGFRELDKPLGNSGHSGCDRQYLKYL